MFELFIGILALYINSYLKKNLNTVTNIIRVYKYM